MSLANPDTVDLVALGPRGEVLLVICDTGVGYQPHGRLRLLYAKLATCVSYAHGDRFAQKYPGKSPRDVRIVVTCSTPPTPQMRRITAVSLNEQSHRIPVEYEEIALRPQQEAWLDAAEQIISARARTVAGLAEAGRTAELARRLAEGADPNEPDELGLPPLHLAVMHGHPDTAGLLLDHGASVDARDRIGFTALHWVARDGERDMVAFLLDRGANANAADPEGHTPLHGAAEGGWAEVAELLLERGADVHARRATGETPLAVAERHRRQAVAEALRRHGAER